MFTSTEDRIRSDLTNVQSELAGTSIAEVPASETEVNSVMSKNLVQADQVRGFIPWLTRHVPCGT